MKSIVTIQGIEPNAIQVYNAIGQMVKTIQMSNEIDLKGLPQGIYSLRIIDENDFFVTKKVIVE